jgi:hypothetical protein
MATETTSKFAVHEEFDGYGVRGWRPPNENAWHIKVFPALYDAVEHRYVVTEGEFDTEPDVQGEREAILKAIRKAS